MSYTTLSGQLGAMRAMEVIANNLANISTPGFRAERLQFETVMAQEYGRAHAGISQKDIQKPNYREPAAFMHLKGSFTDFSQGTVETSGYVLDVALQGKGMFVISTPDGERYTRAGNFKLDPSGRLTTQDGYSVQGTSGDIIVNGTEIDITGEGEILVDKVQIAKFRVVELDPKDIERERHMLFKLKPGTNATEIENYSVRSRALEGSNVNAVRELTDMIMVSRLFESFQKTQESSSRMNELRNSRVGSVS